MSTSIPICYTDVMTQQTVTSLDIFGDEYEVPITELTWRPSAYGIVIDNDRVLLVKVGNGYHMPGGGIDLGEMPEAAVIREVKEESGIEVANTQLIASLSTFFTMSHRIKKDGKAHVQALHLYYACDMISGELSTDHMMQDEKRYGLTPEWVPLKHLDNLVVGSTVDWRSIVKQALKNK